MRPGREHVQAGQASIELLAGLPVLLAAALASFQLLATGYALTLADGAAEAGAIATADRGGPRGRRPRRAAGLGAGQGRGLRAGREPRGRAAAARAAVRAARRPQGFVAGVGEAAEGRGRIVSSARATLVVTGADRGGALALAAAVASEAAAVSGRAALLAELGDEARRRPATLLAAPASRELESRLRGAGVACSARGHICHLGAEAGEEDLERVGLLAEAAGAEMVVIALPPQALGRRARACCRATTLGAGRAC